MGYEWRSLPLHRRSGSDIFETLFGQEPIATLLESPANVETPSTLARYAICAGKPRSTIDSAGNIVPAIYTPKIGNIFPLLQSLLAENTSEECPFLELPFTGGWLGWLTYEAGWEIESLPPIKPDFIPFPPAYWYEPDTFAIADFQLDILYLAARNIIELDKLSYKLTGNGLNNNLDSLDIKASEIRLFFSAEEYQSAVRKVKEYIKEGDIFQANLSLRFETQTTASSWEIYQKLQAINPSPFASYWRSPWGDIISCSPERLIKVKDRLVETRPIAGTRPRGQNKDSDRLLAEELSSNRKEIAEHIMLVDLARNDLGRVCTFGTVRTDELMTIEKYSHVMHLVSNVIGELAVERNPIEAIKATFPGGTITGCPKIRCMEIISELEPLSRNLFYGSCGYLDRRGNLDLNILIRTLLYDRGKVWGQVGAGIVADSEPEREWQESLQKARAQLIALGINEST
jgi:para-aminobenzoate synthetase component I